MCIHCFNEDFFIMPQSCEINCEVQWKSEINFCNLEASREMLAAFMWGEPQGLGVGLRAGSCSFLLRKGRCIYLHF